jgi:GNAT superfamily N-acetyltransferase
MSFSIIKTHPQLISYVDSLQRANVDALSFYPRQVFEREAEKGRIFLALLEGEPCGYIYTGAGANRDLKCHQVCIQYDARRRLYGASLVVAMEEYALSITCSRITLRCGFDLDANEFWASLGYTCVAVTDGGIRRMRKINTWVKQIDAELFQLEGVEPASGVQDASVWRKHKRTGVTTQFARGKKLRDYRALILP